MLANDFLVRLMTKLAVSILIENDRAVLKQLAAYRSRKDVQSAGKYQAIAVLKANAKIKIRTHRHRTVQRANYIPKSA